MKESNEEKESDLRNLRADINRNSRDGAYSKLRFSNQVNTTLDTPTSKKLLGGMQTAMKDFQLQESGNNKN